MRQALRHFIGALAYRGTNILGDAPEEIGTFRPSPAVRTPGEILNHVNGVLMYAHSFMRHYDSTRPPPTSWGGEVKRFFEILQELDESLADASVTIRDVAPEQLLQGPLADSMLHLGQIGIFRRIAGYPVQEENYVFADIRIGELRKPDFQKG